MSADHWALARLSDIAEVRLGRQRSPKRSIGPNLRPYMRAANVTWKGISLHNVKEMDFTPAEFETYRLRRGDLLLSEASGSASEVGKPAVWQDQVSGCCFQNTLIRVRASGDLVPFLHLHFYKDAVTGAFADASRGVGIHHLGASALNEWRVHLPPLEEQHRIVEAIESQFTRLDDAVATLERVQRNLKRYRASVLKAAVEGRLVPTEAELARAKGRDYEPASVLLERILVERRRRWEEAEMPKMKANGRVPKDDKWKAKYKEPAAPDTTDLPELPEGWCWTTVESISSKVVDGVHRKPVYVDSGIPFVTVKNLTAGPGISFEDLHHITESDHEQFIVRTNPERGDLLISKDGPLGVVRAIRTDKTFSIFVSVALVKPILGAMTDYLEVALSSPVMQAQMVPKGSGLQHIHLEDLRADCIPVPPQAEWSRVCAAVQRHVSAADELEREIAQSVARCTRLRQSILKWAFEGRLVDQDPADEPASVLLERIRAERDAAAAARPTRTPRRPTATKKART